MTHSSALQLKIHPAYFWSSYFVYAVLVQMVRVDYGKRNFISVNLELSDEDGQALGKFQMYVVSSVSRQDVAVLQQA